MSMPLIIYQNIVKELLYQYGFIPFLSLDQYYLVLPEVSGLSSLNTGKGQPSSVPGDMEAVPWGTDFYMET